MPTDAFAVTELDTLGKSSDTLVKLISKVEYYRLQNIHCASAGQISAGQNSAGTFRLNLVLQNPDKDGIPYTHQHFFGKSLLATVSSLACKSIPIKLSATQ